MVLTVERIAVRYRGAQGAVQALTDVSLGVDAGELVVVQGPSGGGKSTLLMAAGGLLAPDEGKVRIEGENLYALTSERRARLRADRIGFIFQQFHLVPYLSVLENVLAPSLAAPAPEAPEFARELVVRFGLGERMQHVPAQLSTGERQRTALARALLNRPRLLLADEPTGNLDQQNAKLVLDHLAEFARSGGAVLLVTHDARAARHAQQTVRLQSGRLLPHQGRCR